MGFGNVFIDLNNNGTYEPSDTPISNLTLSSSPGNYVGISYSNGYRIQVDSHATNTISLNLPNPSSWTVSPPSHTIQVAGGGEVPGTYNFGLQSRNIADLETVMFCSPSRPGFTQNISIRVNNIGSTTPMTDITLSIPNGWQALSFTPTPTSVAGGIVTWANVDFGLFEQERFNVMVQIPTTTPLGTAFTYIASTSTSFNDATPQNNSYSYSGVVRGSYDPNDKSVSPTILPPSYDANMDFIYTIRFQNTGTDTAFTVVIRDNLSHLLDASTFRVVNTSHEYRATLIDGAKVEVVFPNIFLVDSFTNEPLSHGFVQFAIKPKANLPINTQIPNTAAIYFDFNTPIITNTATTEIQLSTGIHEAEVELGIAPNPTKDIAVLSYNTHGKPATLYLTNVLGQTMETYQLEGEDMVSLDMGSHATGIYFLTLMLDNKVFGVGKLVIRF